MNLTSVKKNTLVQRPASAGVVMEGEKPSMPSWSWGLRGPIAPAAERSLCTVLAHLRSHFFKIDVAVAALCLLCAVQLSAEVPQKALAAAKTALEGWELDYADHPGPKVDAGDGFKGYRVIFTRRYDEDVEKGIAGTTKPRFNHMDLVLVPQAKNLDALEARTSIPWSQMPEEYFSIPRWIGSAYGFEWFCRSNIMDMDLFRRKMKLTGGEPRKSILAAGLVAEDRDSTTAKYVVGELKAFGKDAIPDIVPAISSMNSAGKTPYAPMNALKLLGCKEADNALTAYFASPDEKVSFAAGSALCTPPYVEKAKDAYLKILKEGRNIQQCAEACRLFGLKDEAAVQLKAIANSPKTLADFRDAMLALSALKTGKGDPVPFDLAAKIADAAVHSGEAPGTPKTFVMGETKEANKAKLAEMDLKRMKPFEDQLAAYPNADVVFVATLWLCMFNAVDSAPEYSARVREAGGRVMRTLPRQTTETYLSRLSAKLESKDEADAMRKLYRRTASLATPTERQTQPAGTNRKAK